MATPDFCTETISVHSVSHIGKMPNVNVQEEGNRQFRVVQQANKQVQEYVTNKIIYKLEFYVLKCLFSAILLYRVCRCGLASV